MLFSAKFKTRYISSFAGHIALVTAIQLYCCSTKEATDKMYVNGVAVYQ